MKQSLALLRIQHQNKCYPEKGNDEIEYCPTDEMTADLMTKALQGEKFIKFRNLMG